MKVLQLLTSVNVEDTVAQINAMSETLITTKESYVNKFLSDIKNKVVTKTDYIIEISHLSIKHDNPVEDEEHLDVSIVVDNISHSMSLSPWSIILGCDVVCDVPNGLPLEKQAALIYREMTIHGDSEEDTVGVVDTLCDITENTNKSNHSVKPLYSPDKGDIFDALFPECSEDEKAKMREDNIRQVENYKTRRFYKNGILHPVDFFDSKPVLMV